MNRTLTFKYISLFTTKNGYAAGEAVDQVNMVIRTGAKFRSAEPWNNTKAIFARVLNGRIRASKRGNNAFFCLFFVYYR